MSKLLEILFLTVIKNNPDETIVDNDFPSSVFSCTASSFQKYSPFIIIIILSIIGRHLTTYYQCMCLPLSRHPYLSILADFEATPTSSEIKIRIL
jgi:hypothetical protein